MTIRGTGVRLVRIEYGDCECGTEVTVLFVELDGNPGTIFESCIAGTGLAIPRMDSADCLEHDGIYVCDDCIRAQYVKLNPPPKPPQKPTPGDASEPEPINWFGEGSSDE